MGAAHCDVFAMFGEPRAATAERIADFRARAARHGRTPGFNLSFRPILGESEGQAWDKAHAILAEVEAAPGAQLAQRPWDESGRRLMDHADKGDVHDERFWTALARAYGAKGNTTCLVGTADQVVESLLDYYQAGCTTFILRGFDPLNDAIDFGRELIPMLRERVGST